MIKYTRITEEYGCKSLTLQDAINSVLNITSAVKRVSIILSPGVYVAQFKCDPFINLKGK